MVDHLAFAAVYDLAIAPFEALGLRTERARLGAKARGRVLDVGGGTGLNLPHFTSGTGVTEVVVCEPDAAMRRALERRATVSDVPVSISPLGVPGLPFPAASFDTVVCTLVLCTVPDPVGALLELRRLVRDDGQLLFLEHVIARTVVGRVQRAAAPLWERVAAGCRLDRDTIAAIRTAGFVVTDCERPHPFGRLSAQTIVSGRAVPRQDSP